MQGGSTITQQYVKNAWLSSDRTLDRKVDEARMAVELEQKLTKDEILERYLNTIYFGHGAWGVASAARVYFGKSVDRLDLAQSAMIAGCHQVARSVLALPGPEGGARPTGRRARAHARTGPRLAGGSRSSGGGRRSRPRDSATPAERPRTSWTGSEASSSSASARRWRYEAGSR